MKVCIPCKKEMLCTKTGMSIVFGTSHVYQADRFECPECGHTIAICANSPHHDPDVLTRENETYVQME